MGRGADSWTWARYVRLSGSSDLFLRWGKFGILQYAAEKYSVEKSDGIRNQEDKSLPLGTWEGDGSCVQLEGLLQIEAYRETKKPEPVVTDAGGDGYGGEHSRNLSCLFILCSYKLSCSGEDGRCWQSGKKGIVDQAEMNFPSLCLIYVKEIHSIMYNPHNVYTFKM